MLRGCGTAAVTAHWDWVSMSLYSTFGMFGAHFFLPNFFFFFFERKYQLILDLIPQGLKYPVEKYPNTPDQKTN